MKNLILKLTSCGIVSEEEKEIFSDFDQIKNFFLKELKKMVFSNKGERILNGDFSIERNLIICLAFFEKNKIEKVRKETIYKALENLSESKKKFLIKPNISYTFYSPEVNEELLNLIECGQIVRTFPQSYVEGNPVYYSLSFDGWMMALKWLEGYNIKDIERRIFNIC